MSSPIRLGVYRHYLGKLYHVIGIARHEQTLEELVIYRALYDNYGLWARSRAVFFEQVDDGGALVDRFSFVAETDKCAPEVD